MRKHLRYFFNGGLENLKVSEAKGARERLIALIAPGRKSTFYSYANYGWRDIPHHMYEAITGIFAEYGIPEESVWRKEEG